MSRKATINFQNNGSEFNVLCEPDKVFDIFKKMRYSGSELKKIIGESEIYRIVDDEIYNVHSISV